MFTRGTTVGSFFRFADRLHPIVDQRTAVKPTLILSSTTVSISDAYDGGNIDFVGHSENSEPLVSLKIKPDPYTELEKMHHLQYFSFRSVVGSDESDDDTANKTIHYEIINAKDTSYAEAWRDYTVFYTTSLNDPDSWRRKENSSYENGKLMWSHEHEPQATSGVYFAYFPPFSYARHLDLVERCSTYASVTSLGQSLEGRELECITVGTGDTTAWIIHRQHPGEHMAEFFAEGLLTRLLGLDAQGDTDGLVRRLLEKFTFYIVPSMNPDGAAKGHLRTNACGANLNREWCDTNEEGYAAPSLERSPEVYHVLEHMQRTGCDVFCDIHGDEEMPYNFLAQPGVPNWGPRLEALHGMFNAAYARANPDMQQKFGYEARGYEEGKSVLNKATDQVSNRFDCLAVTLEMPFKDCWSNPDSQRGWSPARSRSLGASLPEPLYHVHKYLRKDADEDGSFWKYSSPDDAYVLPTSDYRK
ncbi:MAG: hypothetical protein SGILL_001226 [Bacillariaceae sp.]